MKLKQIEGGPIIVRCDGCSREAPAGTLPYISASTGEVCLSEEFYQSDDGGIYCPTCAAKLTEVDPTRSVKQFYADTAGTEILPEILGV